jgi:hypothetical protein
MAGLCMNGVIDSQSMVALSWPTQVWMTPSLQPILLSVDRAGSLHFVHHSTHFVELDLAPHVLGYGNTIWVAAVGDGRCAALAFDFALIEPGIVVVADLLRVCSNVYLVDDELEEIPGLARLRFLSSTTHLLNWQEKVLEHIPEALHPRVALSSRSPQAA